MPDWEHLFRDPRNIQLGCEVAVTKLIRTTSELFEERPLRMWDLGCGAGRHTVALAAAGCEVWGSDISPTGLEITRERLADAGLSAHLMSADMTDSPFSDVGFHTVVSWAVIHHNTLSNIEKCLSVVKESLVPGGLFMFSVKSTRADGFGKGDEIEPATFIPPDGPEQGVPHHYFDEAGIRSLITDWEIMFLVEGVMDYRERGDMSFELNPFGYTNWLVLVRKPGGSSIPDAAVADQI